MRALVSLLLLLSLASPGLADPSVDRVTVETHKPFAAYVEAMPGAITASGFNIVGVACATCAIQNALGETVAGNRVFLFFRPDYAHRMLQADVEAGIEAPIRLYVTERPDGTARVTYRAPSAVFGAYGNDALTDMGRELDAHMRSILDNAAANS